MTIEFPCNRCQTTLSVEDDSAGATTRCPRCDAMLIVPAEHAVPNPFGENGVGSKPQVRNDNRGEVNPYDSPQPVSQPIRDAAPLGDGEIRPTAARVGDILEFAFETWKENLGMVVGVALPLMASGFIFVILETVVEEWYAESGDIITGQRLGRLLSMTDTLIQLYLGIGMNRVYLKILRGQDTRFGDVFTDAFLFLKILFATILAWIALAIGLVALIVPGIPLVIGLVVLIVPDILLMVFFWPFYYILVDGKAGIMESFSIAGSIGKENVLTTILLWLAGIGIMLLGLLACGIGLVLASPLVSLISVTAYLMMTGQLNARGIPTDYGDTAIE